MFKEKPLDYNGKGEGTERQALKGGSYLFAVKGREEKDYRKICRKAV